MGDPVGSDDREVNHIGGVIVPVVKVIECEWRRRDA